MESTSDPRRIADNVWYAQRMELSDEQIQSFIECWKKDFNEVLTPAQARVEARRLLEFFGELAKMLRRLAQSRSP